jgi:hypothetical protein
MVDQNPNQAKEHAVGSGEVPVCLTSSTCLCSACALVQGTYVMESWKAGKLEAPARTREAAETVMSGIWLLTGCVDRAGNRRTFPESLGPDDW